jgi:hypothetical protein|tara:strand:+ start:519 stop:629 length:111 start_codon:yes stop_codon:yes gene_type:complete
MKKTKTKSVVKPFPKKKPQTDQQARTAWLIERRLTS